MANHHDALETTPRRGANLSRLTSDELARFRAGDETIFRRVVDAYSPRLLAFLRSFATDLDEAHDLLQDVWHRAYDKRGTYSGSGTLLGWLYAISRSTGLAAGKKRSVRDRVTVEHAYHTGAPPANPDVATERAALRRSLRHALVELPEREREVVILRMIEQRSTRETAAALDCAEGTVKAALHHALKKLQSSMEAWVP